MCTKTFMGKSSTVINRSWDIQNKPVVPTYLYTWAEATAPYKRSGPKQQPLLKYINIHIYLFQLFSFPSEHIHMHSVTNKLQSFIGEVFLFWKYYTMYFAYYKSGRRNTTIASYNFKTETLSFKLQYLSF